MKEIYYKSSEGEIISLIGTPYRMLTETDVFNWEWQYEQAGTNYPYITAFKNQMVSKSISVRVSGTSEDDFYNNLEHLIEVVDRDVRLDQMGRLYCGDYFIECFITGTTKAKVFRKTYTTLGLTLLAENGDWKREQLSSYTGLSGGKYLNNYIVPSVSSNENDYSYGTMESLSETFTFTADFVKSYDVSYYQTFTIESVTANIQYRLNEGNYTTVTPSDCPLEIDLSSEEIPRTIDIKPSTYLTMEVSAEVLENASYFNWTCSDDDTTREVIFDLGLTTDIESITGIDVYPLTTNVGTVTLQISSDGANWVTVDAESFPMQSGNYKVLSYEPSSPTDLRFIKIKSQVKIAIKTNSFIVEAHFTGEEQNLATSVIVNSDDSDGTYEINDGIVSMEQHFDSLLQITKMSFTLPKSTTVVAINNLDLINTWSNDVLVGISGNYNGGSVFREDITVEPNETVHYSWSGEETIERIDINVFGRYLEISSNNFEILEEQTIAPHRYILNENYVPSDAIIKIYGATNSPSIMIGDSNYGAENITLDDGEFLEINTKDETIQHYVDSEGWINVFNHRLDETFNKVEVGTSEITWQGNLTVDIELLNSRSDPKWN